MYRTLKHTMALLGSIMERFHRADENCNLFKRLHFVEFVYLSVASGAYVSGARQRATKQKSHLQA